MMTISKEKVLRLHHILTQETGGDDSMRDVTLLESALGSAFATFGGAELYPTIEEKAARLGFALISNHAFVDGNKRIGVLVMLTFLAVNGVRLFATDADVVALGLGVAAGEMQYEDVLAWVRAQTWRDA